MDKEFAALGTEFTAVEKRGQNLVVTDKASAEFVTETAVIASRLFNAVENRRKVEVDPLNTQLDEINGRYKKITRELDRIKKQAKAAVEAWMNEQDRIAAAEALRIAKEEEEARAKELMAAHAQEVEAPSAPLASFEEAPVAPAAIASDTGLAQKSKHWTYEVLDIKQVEAKFLLINNKDVMAAIHAGERNIPGLRIFQKSQLSVR